MYLIHDVIPFAVQKLVVSVCNVLVLLKLCQSILRPGICAGALLRSVKIVLRNTNIDLTEC